MNVFEDLIEELKDEKLLEETVTARKAVSAGMPVGAATLQVGAATATAEILDHPSAVSAGIQEDEPEIGEVESRKKRVMEEEEGSGNVR
jgi:hypothetical protein